MRRYAFILPIKNSSIEELFIKGTRFSVAQLFTKKRDFRFWPIGNEVETEKVNNLSPPLGAGGFKANDIYCISDDNFSNGYIALELEFEHRGEVVKRFENRMFEYAHKMTSGGHLETIKETTLGINIFSLDGFVSEAIFCQDYFLQTSKVCYYIRLKIKDSSLEHNSVLYDKLVSKRVSNNSSGTYYVFGSGLLSESQLKKYYNMIELSHDKFMVLRTKFEKYKLPDEVEEKLRELNIIVSMYKDVICENKKLDGVLEELTDLIIANGTIFNEIVAKFVVQVNISLNGWEWW